MRCSSVRHVFDSSARGPPLGLWHFAFDYWRCSALPRASIECRAIGMIQTNLRARWSLQSALVQYVNYSELVGLLSSTYNIRNSLYSIFRHHHDHDHDHHYISRQYFDNSLTFKLAPTYTRQKIVVSTSYK